MKRGVNVEDQNSSYGFSRKAILGQTPLNSYLVHGPYLPLGAGNYEVNFRVKARILQDGPVAKLDVVCDDAQTVLAQTIKTSHDFGAANGWQNFRLPFSISRNIINDIEFRVQYLGNADLSVECIQLPTQYNVEVIDLTPELKDRATWVSPTDGHPNAQTHKIMADILFHHITGGK